MSFESEPYYGWKSEDLYQATPMGSALSIFTLLTLVWEIITQSAVSSHYNIKNLFLQAEKLIHYTSVKLSDLGLNSMNSNLNSLNLDMSLYIKSPLFKCMVDF